MPSGNTDTNQANDASLIGSVVDGDGAALADVTIVAANQETGGEGSTQSGPHGTYGVAALAAGTYTVTFTLSGYRPTVEQAVQLSAAETTYLNVAMQRAE